MSAIQIKQNRIHDKEAAIALCPFGAIVEEDESLIITAACKMCRICIKSGPEGAFTLHISDKESRDYSDWKHIAVFGEVQEGRIHPVTFELIGKALELSKKVSTSVSVYLIGHSTNHLHQPLLSTGISRIYCYDHRMYAQFKVELFTAALEDVIERDHPGVLLFGGTPIGRSVGPRIAARCRTGLTADCTSLDISKEGFLEQVRPAFGGNIMAQIRTAHARPQCATVRYKIFNKAPLVDEPRGAVIACPVPDGKHDGGVQIQSFRKKPIVEHLEDADTIIAAGRGIKKQSDMTFIYQLANQLNAKVGCTRPLVERGWCNPRDQIGLSGRTVKPKLLITCGISGSVQFTAGMKGSEFIIAINNDPDADIFSAADIGIVGNIYEVLPELLNSITEGAYHV